MITLSALRTACATRVSGLSGWKESPYPFDVLGRDPASIAHLAFAIGTPHTEPLGSRQRRSVGVYSRTTVVVRFTARVKPKDAVASVGEALDFEGQLVIRMMEATWPGTFDLQFVAADRASANDVGDFLRHDVTFHALHQFALQ